MCDYAPKCKAPANYWVQSLLSTHDALACAQHLPRTVREITKKAREYDLLNPTRPDAPDLRYVRDDDPSGQSLRITRRQSNYAYVTVKYQGDQK